jgi:hypothetical protein
MRPSVRFALGVTAPGACVFGDQIDNSYQAFANPSVNDRIIGVQIGLDICRGSFIQGHCDAAGPYFANGHSAGDVDGLVTNPARPHT